MQIFAASIIKEFCSDTNMKVISLELWVNLMKTSRLTSSVLISSSRFFSPQMMLRNFIFLRKVTYHSIFEQWRNTDISTAAWCL